MPQRKDDLKRAEKEWYAKLKKAGFEDIEDTSIKERPLKAWHSFKYQAMDPVAIKAIQVYYEKAQDLVFTFKFENRDHKRVWTLHAQGQSARDIAKRVKYRKTWVIYLIDMIARLNGLKE